MRLAARGLSSAHGMSLPSSAPWRSGEDGEEALSSLRNPHVSRDSFEDREWAELVERRQTVLGGAAKQRVLREFFRCRRISI